MLREILRSRAISLIDFPWTKCSRRIRPIVSTTSIPHHLLLDQAGSQQPSTQGGQFWTPIPRLRGSKLHAETHRGQVRGVQSPLPCVRSTVLIPWRPPSLARVPVSPVPRGQRSYEGATTSRLRIPGRLSVSLPGSARSSALRARLGGAPGWLEDPSGPGHLVSRPPICRHSLSRTQAGSHRFPGDPSHAFAPVQDPGRTDDPHPDGVVDAAPLNPRRRLQR